MYLSRNTHLSNKHIPTYISQKCVSLEIRIFPTNTSQQTFPFTNTSNGHSPQQSYIRHMLEVESQHLNNFYLIFFKNQEARQTTIITIICFCFEQNLFLFISKICTARMLPSYMHAMFIIHVMVTVD